MKKQIDEMIEDKLTMSKETKETLESILEKGLAKIRPVVLGPDLRLTIPKNAFDAGFNFDEVVINYDTHSLAINCFEDGVSRKITEAKARKFFKVPVKIINENRWSPGTTVFNVYQSPVKPSVLYYKEVLNEY